MLDLYDVKANCRHPELLSSTPTALLGHESGWSPDGLTFYASSTGGQTLVAIDLTDPHRPEADLRAVGCELPRHAGLRRRPHALRREHRRLRRRRPVLLRRAADPRRQRDPGPRAEPAGPRHPGPHLARALDPAGAEPFTRNGHDYLLEVDEFANYSLTAGVDQAKAPVGAARIIDVDRPASSRRSSPTCGSRCTSRARGRATRRTTPGPPIPVQGYAGHYCSVPYVKNPKVVACSMILSGLRVFDISDLRSTRARSATSTSR